MRTFRTAIAAVVFLLISSAALACECSNHTPIQNTSATYRRRAVFTAYVIKLIGQNYNFGGKQSSDRVLAVVHERYWGFPPHWPKVVILNGSYPCDMSMDKDEEYLVAGFPGRYGEFAVNGCSRTQPLQTAQVDLRTLDGSHCAEPGGTLIGHVLKGDLLFSKSSPVPNFEVHFRDQDGRTYSAQTDNNGIYELRHLAAGIYTLDSLVSENQYVQGEGAVQRGLCEEVGIHFSGYSVRGRLLPGLIAVVSLVKVDGPTDLVSKASTEAVSKARIEPDGRFYFANVPAGEYLLAVETSWIPNAKGELYYPGTYDRAKAARITVTSKGLAGGGEIDFKPERLPVVSIPIALDPPDDSGRFSWRVQLTNPSVVGEKTWVSGAKYVLLYGTRDSPYKVFAFGWSQRPLEYDNCRSAETSVVAKVGVPTIHLAIPPNCR